VIAEQCKARAGEHHGRDRHERCDPELSNVQSGDAQENRQADQGDQRSQEPNEDRRAPLKRRKAIGRL